MATLYRKGCLVFSVLFTAFLVYVIVGLIWTFVSIQLRLQRNNKIAQQLVVSLEDQFPQTEFRGAANYEQDIIYITVVNRLDEAERLEIEICLRKQKNEQKITPRIWLRFANDFDKVIVIE